MREDPGRKSKAAAHIIPCPYAF